MERIVKSFTTRCVLGVAAHPDDLDFGAAGSMAVWAAAGAKCYYLILTNGNKGTADKDLAPEKLIADRRREQRAAAKLLGVTDVFFADYEDGALEVTLALKRDIVRVIRQVRPDVVVTTDPSMIYSVDSGFINHPDHRAAGQAALDAVYPLARDHLVFPELLAEGLEPHKVKTVLLNNFDKQNFYVDISETIDKKMAALAAHVSQMSELVATQKRMRELAERMGAQANCAYAEAFLRIDIK